MTVKTIAHMEWTVTVLNSGERTYMNTTEGITGVAVIGEPGKFSYVIMAEDETSPRYVYDNTEFSHWNSPRVWGILEDLASNMYDVEQELYGLYEDDYDANDDGDYEYENDSDLHNEY